MISAENLPVHFSSSIAVDVVESTSQSFDKLCLMRESKDLEVLAVKRQSGLNTGGNLIFLGRETCDEVPEVRSGEREV